MKSTKYKTYVCVEVKIDEDGNLTPLSIIWEDGQKFEIDKITDVRPAASFKAGGIGTRFTCMIHGQEKYLFWENPQWFVEAIQ